MEPANDPAAARRRPGAILRAMTAPLPAQPDDAPTDQPAVKPPPTPARRTSGPAWTRLLLGLISVLLLLTLLFQLTHRPRYEYLVASPDDFKFTEEIGALGAQGWKIDTCRRATDNAGGASYECILSRPRLGW